MIIQKNEQAKRDARNALPLPKELARRAETRATNIAGPVGKIFKKLSELCPDCSPDALLAAAVALDARHAYPPVTHNEAR